MTVKITARALLYDKSADSGLSGQVFREDQAKGVVFVNRITVPIVDYASESIQDARELSNAEPGKYFLQLLLPNGKTITRNFEITPEKSTKLVIDLPHEGPHEWTALHALTGRFRHEARQTRGFTRSLSGSPQNYAVLAEHPQKGYTLSLLIPDENAAGSIFKNNQTLSNLSQLIHKDLDVQSAAECFGGGSAVNQPTDEDSDFAIFRFAHCGLLAYGQKDPTNYYFGPGTGLSRHYLLQKSASGGTLICLPTPWTTPAGQAEVELLVKKNSLTEMPDVNMTISDPMINTVLGYINAGAIHEAAELIDFKKSEQMLFDKMSCPLAAAVGGYLLVLGVDRKRYRAASNDWKNWVEHLDHWFDWLPDGAVLHAALYFMLGGPDRDEAYQALMRACDRGLPFFTFGLKLMLDGMRYFAREGDAEARKRLTILEAIADQTDPSAAFLTVTFSRHW